MDYSGVLNIRLDRNGLNYVYDITNIKRTTNQRLSTAEADTFAGEEPSSGVNIAQKEGNNGNSRLHFDRWIHVWYNKIIFSEIGKES